MNFKVLTILSVLLYGCCALKCYTCQNCDKEGVQPKEETCKNGLDRCFKFAAGDYVMKQCSGKNICDLGSFEQSFKTSWENTMQFAKNFLKEQGLQIGQEDNNIQDFKEEMEDALKSDKGTQSVNCCEGDLCNGSEITACSSCIMLFSLFFAFFLMF